MWTRVSTRRSSIEMTPTACAPSSRPRVTARTPALTSACSMRSSRPRSALGREEWSPVTAIGCAPAGTRSGLAGASIPGPPSANVHPVVTTPSTMIRHGREAISEAPLHPEGGDVLGAAIDALEAFGLDHRAIASGDRDGRPAAPMHPDVTGRLEPCAVVALPPVDARERFSPRLDPGRGGGVGQEAQAHRDHQA